MNVSIDREDGRYEAGGVLRATWRVRRVPVERIEGVEVSVMWYTEGKGDEDLHVHYFERFSGDQLRNAEVRRGEESPGEQQHAFGEQQHAFGQRQHAFGQRQRIECRLPPTPLSYHGRLVRIRWCIRLRLFMDDGRSIVAEQPFHLVAYDATARPRFWVGDMPAEPTREIPADAGEIPADAEEIPADAEEIPADAEAVHPPRLPSDDLPSALQP